MGGRRLAFLLISCIALSGIVSGCEGRSFDYEPPVVPPPPIDDIEVWINYNSFDYVRSLTVAGDYLWVTSLNGAARLNTLTGEHIKLGTADGLASKWVAGSAVDVSGNAWFATYAGVSRFDGRSVRSMRAADSGLINNTVNAVAADRDGALWFATVGGVNKLSGSNWQLYDTNTTNKGIAENWVAIVVLDGKGQAWFGTELGASKFDGKSWVGYNTHHGMPDNKVWAIAFDSDGVWFGTPKGAAHFVEPVWTAFKALDSGLPSNQVMSIAVDGRDRVWFGTSSGAAVLDGENWTRYDPSNSGLPDDFVHVVAIGDDGSAWFGTRAGVTRFDGREWKTYTVQELGLTR